MIVNIRGMSTFEGNTNYIKHKNVQNAFIKENNRH